MKKWVLIAIGLLAFASCATQRSTGPDIPKNTNGIWLWSKYMNEVDLDELKAKGIGNIILHEVAFARHGEDSTMTFINSAERKGIRVHVWFQCFYDNGTWINPVDDENNRYKQEYFDEVITRAEHYVDLGVKGIHLDYIRFGGTAYKHNPSEEITAVGCVTEFCRQIDSALNVKNPAVVLSAALMPEPDSEYYYGQDPAKMGQYIDILMPMIYRHSPTYAKGGENWATDVARFFVEKGAPAQVWAGTTTYTGDDGVVREMSPEDIIRDCEDFYGTGVKGVVLFRYGIGEIPDMSNINFE